VAAMMAEQKNTDEPTALAPPEGVGRMLVAPHPDAPTLAASPVIAAEPAESEFRSFGLAIVLGILIGIPVLAGLVAAGVWFAAPDTDPIAIAGIALWVSLFCGPFLAGTVTVGLWSSRHH